MDKARTLSGHCLCGACRFELYGDHNWVGHCHCESCRRTTSSGFTTWIGQENGKWALTGQQPQVYSNRATSTRGFCGTCGSPIYFRSDRYPNEMHFYAALLTDPSGIVPERHYHGDEKLAWVHLSDGLPGLL